MLNMCLLLIIMLFCTLGIYFTVKEITAIFLKNEVQSRLVMVVKNGGDNLEYILRSTLRANPQSDITVINKSNSTEIASILEKFAADNPRVRIRKAPEQ